MTSAAFLRAGATAQGLLTIFRVGNGKREVVSESKEIRQKGEWP
jgi:hypothetical protein